MSTIELTNNIILYKLEILKQMATDNHLLLEEIEHLEIDYNLGSINIIMSIFENNDNGKLYDEYNTYIQTENYVNKIEDLYKRCEAVCKNNIEKFREEFFSNDIFQSIIKHNYDICPECGKKMYNTGFNEIFCEHCGVSLSMCSSYIEEESGQLESKHGTYDPIKHFKIWFERIQANEPFEPTEAIINQIKQCILRDKISNKNEISCKRIRRYLQQTKNSNLNEHVPLIRKIITGISPPQLNECEVHLVFNFFNKIILVYMEIKSPKKTNCPYIPYFIYKIIEQILPSQTKTERIRKYKILTCIHLQSRDTLIENDKTWKKICERIAGFIYIPTDRNSGEYEEYD